MPTGQSLYNQTAINPLTLTFNDSTLEAKYREAYRLSSIRTFLTYAIWMVIILTVGFGAFFWVYQLLRPLLFLYYSVRSGLGMIRFQIECGYSFLAGRCGPFRVPLFHR